MDTGWRNSRISRSFSRSDKRPMLTIATSVEKRCSRTNQPKDINRGVVYPHICVKIPWDRVFIPYGLEVTVMRFVKIDQDRYDFIYKQRLGSAALDHSVC
jgi:hypothetical protein